MATETPLLLVTPTYPRPLRLGFLRRCAEDFRGVPNLLWLVVEDDTGLAADVERLLRESGITYVYIAHGPTRSWGNAQRNRAFQYIRDHRLTGVVYLTDDDNKYQPPRFEDLRRIRRVGILVGRLHGSVGHRASDCTRRLHRRMECRLEAPQIPVDMAAFGFNAALLAGMSGDPWTYQGRGGETEFIERLIGSADELELLCNDARDCYVWHDLPLGWSIRLGLVAYLVRRRAPRRFRRRLNRAFRRIWLTEGSHRS